MRIYTNETPKHKGKEVELAGWVNARRDHGKLIFIDLRDKSGIVQVVFTPKDNDIYDLGNKLRPEWVVRITGEVKERPDGMKNSDIETGDIEISASKLEILSEAQTPPIAVDTDGTEIGEESRMKYRYLDLRRRRLQDNLRARSDIIGFIRKSLRNKGFLEIATPYLGKSTPEGARDYLVPSRAEKGKFYALPQSPQQYKQLLMVSGFEKYFQIVRCFRDEDTRGDRQPEFTQLDMEISFVDEEDVIKITEDIFINLVKELYPKKKLLLEKGSIPRISHVDAMKEYKTDRPDLRKDKKNPDELAFAFVVNFPMFEWKETEKRWDAVHHPFTQPKVKDLEDFEKEFEKAPEKILAKQYDLVLNGEEIAGGSIRIHNPKLLSKIFEVMGNKPKDVEEKFGHMLEAFKYGVPPHGGVAVGLDRFIMLMQNEPNIREIIAFPKTGDGRDLMMGAPSEVDKEQLKELGLEIKNPKPNRRSGSGSGKEKSKNK